MIYRQSLLTLAVILIIVGAIIWLVAWPASAQEATDVIGQALFWPGIVILIIWIIAFTYDALVTHKTN